MFALVKWVHRTLRKEEKYQLSKLSTPWRIHGAGRYIYLHENHKNQPNDTKCRLIYHTWILWEPKNLCFLGDSGSPESGLVGLPFRWCSVCSFEKWSSWLLTSSTKHSPSYSKYLTSWWFQPIWKTQSNWIISQVRVKIENVWNHQLKIFSTNAPSKVLRHLM